MAILRIKGDKARFNVLNNECLGKPCLVPGHFQVRGGTPSGSRNTGETSPCCMTRAYHGCPGDAFDFELAKKRKSEGFKIT